MNSQKYQRRNLSQDPYAPTRKNAQKQNFNGVRYRTLSRIETKINMKVHRKSSPYLGYLRHAPKTAPTRSRVPNAYHFARLGNTHFYHANSLSKHYSSPYVGFIRHAPPTSALLYTGTARKKNMASKKAGVWEGFLKKHNCSGRLPGGGKGGPPKVMGSKQPKALVENDFSSYSVCRWFEASPSSGLFQLDTSSTKRITDAYQYGPLDTLEMLNKLAYWFLFPIALDNDANYTFKDVGEMDGLRGFASFFSSLMRRVFQSNFSHSTGTTFEECVSVDTGQNSEHYQCAELEQPRLFQSISSIDSEEIRSSSTAGTQRYLDIESILRLPTMTYEEESSCGVVSSINTYDTDGGKSIKVSEEDEEGAERSGKGLEWSWISVPRESSQSMESIASLVEPIVDHHFKDDQCVICLEKFHTGDRLRILPCQHRFHTSCIDKWLSGSFSHDDCMNALCPTCKSTPSTDADFAHHAQSIESMVSDGSFVENFDDDSMQSMNLDGSVPSWAFARLGSKIAK